MYVFEEMTNDIEIPYFEYTFIYRIIYIVRE